MQHVVWVLSHTRGKSPCAGSSVLPGLPVLLPEQVVAGVIVIGDRHIEGTTRVPAILQRPWEVQRTVVGLP